ncbi:unnamed protein product, partial [Heterosigma akashiwo]
LDISTAFLNGAITDDVYVRQPPGYVNPQHPNKVWKLNKALYGLKQSPRVWYMELHDHLVSLGFTRELTQILGIKVVRDKRNKCFHLSQTSFIRRTLAKLGLDYLPVSHATPGFKAELSDANLYRPWLGRWPGLRTGQDRACFCSPQASAHTQINPEPKHFEAVQRAFRYLKGTQSESLRLGGDLVLRAFSDAGFCNDRVDGKSVTGYILFLGDAPIVWSSKLQGAVTTSTVEAEYVALRSAVKDIMWLRSLLAEMGCPQHEPTPVVEDNSACVEWANDMLVNKRNRHFHVSYHLAKEQVSLGTIRMFFIKTHDQVADILTKALNAANF